MGTWDSNDLGLVGPRCQPLCTRNSEELVDTCRGNVGDDSRAHVPDLKSTCILDAPNLELAESTDHVHIEPCMIRSAISRGA